MNTTRHVSARNLAVLKDTVLAVPTGSPALSSPLGLAFANAAFYTASPDGAVLAIIGKPDL